MTQATIKEYLDSPKVENLQGSCLEGQDFESLIRPFVPAAPADQMKNVQFGNVHFWIDSDGPWAGELSYSIPSSEWDTKAIGRDIAARLSASN